MRNHHNSAVSCCVESFSHSLNGFSESNLFFVYFPDERREYEMFLISILTEGKIVGSERTLGTPCSVQLNPGQLISGQFSLCNVNAA